VTWLVGLVPTFAFGLIFYGFHVDDEVAWGVGVVMLLLSGLLFV